MAANGFIELLRLAKRGSASISNSHEAEHWSGIAFEMFGQYFVAPLGEVAEVIYYPTLTSIPTSKSWLKGIANVRGRLLTVTDLPEYLLGQGISQLNTQKVLCVSHHDHYVGFAVDQVLGIQHFNKKSFFSENDDLNNHVKQYSRGYFNQNERHWNVFLFSKMLNDAEYMNAATK